MLTTHSRKNRLFACLVAVAMCLSVANNVDAGDCGCAASCDACPNLDPGCICHCSRFFKRSCVYKALDAFAGGIEQVLDLCTCCRSRNEKLCDDGCDAAMIDELIVPEAIYYQPLQIHSEPAPVYSAPIPDHQLGSPAPSQWNGSGHMVDPRTSEMRMTQPRIQDQRFGGESGAEPAERQLPPPSRIPVPEPLPYPQPVPDSDTDSKRESLFDSLSDPFRDDEAQTRRYRSVRPSSYDELELRPIRKMPLSRDYTTSSRRAESVR